MLGTAASHSHETRARIVREAERLFRHYGYSKTTVADIAREMGMSPANVYRFFASKAALTEAIAEVMLTERTDRAAAIAAGPGSVEDRIRGVFLSEYRHTHETLMADPRMHEMVEAAMTQQWHVIRAFLDRIDRLVEDLVRQGVAEGVFPEQDARLAARCAHQAMVSWCHPLLVKDCAADPASARPDQMIDFVLHALRAPRP